MVYLAILRFRQDTLANKEFHLPYYDVEARLSRLSAQQVEALEGAFLRVSEKKPRTESEETEELLPLFLLPLAELDFSTIQMVNIFKKVPVGFPLDHREIYFDFRFGIWIKHLEPPSVAAILDECVHNAATKAEGIEYLKLQWRDFLLRHNAK